MVHGDDFVAVGEPKHLAETEAALGKKYKIKTETLGADKGDLKEIKVSNKIIRVTHGGLELEADPRPRARSSEKSSVQSSRVEGDRR